MKKMHCTEKIILKVSINIKLITESTESEKSYSACQETKTGEFASGRFFIWISTETNSCFIFSGPFNFHLTANAPI